MSEQKNQILEKIKAELAAFEEKRKALVAELQQEFPVMFKEIFAQAPDLKSFGWTQYTPYFNDGDTCEFGVNFDYPYLNGEYEDEAELEIRLHKYKKLETEEDVRISVEVAAKTNLSWYLNSKIGEQGLCYNPNYNESAANAVSQIKEVLKSIPEDFFKEMFGDHAKVTLYANGTCTVEDYDHD